MKQLFPISIEIGMSEEEFLQSTPAYIHMRIDAFYKLEKIRVETMEYQSWLTGYYVMHAIGANFSKKCKYPKNPLEQEDIVKEDIQITEDQEDFYREQFVKRLQRMEQRFNKAKEKELQKQGR